MPRALLCVLLCLLPGPRAEAGAIFSAHGWRWQDVMSNMGAIRDAGYTAIQISPHQSSCAGGYGTGCDPYDFTSFDSGFGNASDLGWLIGTAHYFGLRIYADMVMNHMGTRGYYYPRFSPADFHHSGGISNWNDQWQVEN